MRFEWDERKNDENRRKHGYDLRDAEAMFRSFMLVALDDRQDYGEDRWIGIGMIGTRMAVVVYTLLEENCIRIISLRKATSNERQRYEQELWKRLGED